MENKISIIIPAFNIEKYLKDTLDSVLLQTYENIEVIVVNDGSTDGTASLVDEYVSKDSRIRAIHKENGGVTSARLRGVSEATGEWIGFVDGDDYVEPQMFEHLLKNALKYQADISHCGYQMVFPNGRVDYYYNTGRLIQQDRLTGQKELLSGTYIEPALCNKLYHKALFRSLLYEDVMDRSIRNTEDLLMNYYLFKAADCAVFEDVCPYHYILRKNSAATSRLNEHRLLDPLRVTKIILADVVPELQSVLLSRLIRQLVALATLSSKDQCELIIPNRKMARKELRDRLREILQENVDIKLKIMALWVVIWPTSYGLVHRIHAKITGNDKKFEVN